MPLLGMPLDQVVVETDSGDRVVDDIEYFSDPQLLNDICIPLTWYEFELLHPIDQVILSLIFLGSIFLV